jgi:hypothetical protein
MSRCYPLVAKLNGSRRFRPVTPQALKISSVLSVKHRAGELQRLMLPDNFEELEFPDKEAACAGAGRAAGFLPAIYVTLLTRQVEMLHHMMYYSTFGSLEPSYNAWHQPALCTGIMFPFKRTNGSLCPVSIPEFLRRDSKMAGCVYPQGLKALLFMRLVLVSNRSTQILS